jgi:hypothetical protein
MTSSTERLINVAETLSKEISDSLWSRDSEEFTDNDLFILAGRADAIHCAAVQLRLEFGDRANDCKNQTE